MQYSIEARMTPGNEATPHPLTHTVLFAFVFEWPDEQSDRPTAREMLDIVQEAVNDAIATISPDGNERLLLEVDRFEVTESSIEILIWFWQAVATAGASTGQHVVAPDLFITLGATAGAEIAKAALGEFGKDVWRRAKELFTAKRNANYQLPEGHDILEVVGQAAVKAGRELGCNTLVGSPIIRQGDTYVATFRPYGCAYDEITVRVDKYVREEPKLTISTTRRRHMQRRQDLVSVPHNIDATRTNVPPGILVDMWETPNDVIVAASAPGISPTKFKLSILGNVLTIEAEVASRSVSTTDYVLREQPQGLLRREVKLPAQVQVDKISAAPDGCSLTVTLPKAEEAKPKPIQITQPAGGG